MRVRFLRSALNLDEQLDKKTIRPGLGTSSDAPEPPPHITGPKAGPTPSPLHPPSHHGGCPPASRPHTPTGPPGTTTHRPPPRTHLPHAPRRTHAASVCPASYRRQTLGKRDPPQTLPQPHSPVRTPRPAGSSARTDHACVRRHLRAPVLRARARAARAEAVAARRRRHRRDRRARLGRRPRRRRAWLPLRTVRRRPDLWLALARVPQFHEPHPA